MAPLAVLYFIFLIEPCFSFSLGGKDEPVKIINEFKVKGESMDLLSGVVKPFQAWYSQKQNKSRIDYYDGIVKYLYSGDSEGEETKKYFIHAETTEDQLNEMVCKCETTDKKPLNIFPPLDNFTKSADTIFNNVNAEVWKSTQLNEGKKKEEVLYLHKQNGQYIPLWFEVKQYVEWSGTLDRHKVLRYFDIEEPSEKDLDVKEMQVCEDVDITKSNKRNDHLLDEFDVFFSYKMQHKRTYKTDEHEMRRLIFEKNLKKVVEHNKKNSSYKKTINEFSDRTYEELAYLTATTPSGPLETGSIPFPHSEEELKHLAKELPVNFDMRIDGYISVIKNQAGCGSCWSFSTTAAVEGALARNNGDRVLDLSEQSLVDCSWGYFNGGCNGGLVKSTYEYILKHGIPTEREYGAYLEEDGFCKMENMTDIYYIKGFAKVPPMSVTALKVALYKYGPVTVIINATPIKDYANGIFYDPECNTKGPNHGVTVVGYGMRDGTEFFIVKNSWGENWGQDGYILLSAFGNNCHMLQDAYYPVV